jgi:drug/metabolite transporter (DMT)-like permease
VTHTRRLYLKSFPLILLSIVLGPMGNVMLGKGMKSIAAVSLTNFRGITAISSSVLTSPFIWLGIGCLLGFMIVHMLLLTWADYSYVQPATSLSYATVALLSYFLLGESVSPLRWLGIAVICLGVFLVGRTAPSTTGAHS